MNDQIKLMVDMRDWSSESWLCVDCGFNTAPGFLSRVERQKAFEANGRRIQETIDSNSEVYTVHRMGESGPGAWGWLSLHRLH